MIFSQAYWMYVKKNQQSMAGEDPLLGVSAIFKQALDFLRNRVQQKLGFAQTHLGLCPWTPPLFKKAGENFILREAC